MTDKKYEQMIERAKRLMALAEDPAASENEVAIAWEQAQKIMSEYAIEDWQLHRQDRMNDPIIKRKVDLYADPMNPLKADLAGDVARGNQADAYQTSYKSRNGRRVVESITFCGTERDCRQAEMIWTSMETYRASHWRSAARRSGRQANARWRNSYYGGFGFRISERYHELRCEQERNDSTSGSGNELVRVRGAQVAEFMRGLDLREIDLPDTWSHMDTKAFMEGTDAAEQIALGLDELHGSKQIEGKKA